MDKIDNFCKDVRQMDIDMMKLSRQAKEIIEDALKKNGNMMSNFLYGTSTKRLHLVNGEFLVAITKERSSVWFWTLDDFNQMKLETMMSTPSHIVIKIAEFLCQR